MKWLNKIIREHVCWQIKPIEDSFNKQMKDAFNSMNATIRQWQEDYQARQNDLSKIVKESHDKANQNIDTSNALMVKSLARIADAIERASAR